MKNIITDLNIIRKKSQNVDNTEEAQKIIEEIKTYFTKDDRMGIAAIQIGLNKKIAVIKNKNNYFCLINPEIVDKEEEFVYYQEGCLSFPGKFINTNRYKHFTIKNYRINNNQFEEEKLYFYYSNDKKEITYISDPLLSIAVQHELDHFDGILYIDREAKGVTIIREDKVGRNDPCPCGAKDNNGKPIKYKKCCGKNI